MKPRAVLYLRSSKDRHDVAIDAQRRELRELAAARGYDLAGEFADVVESGKDDDRPGLQALLTELYTRGRTWSTVLALDTSRIARRAAAAYWFEDRECRPRGVTVVYKNLPEMEDAERAIVKAVFHGVDEWHSLVSKRKGLAGMRANVRNGHRAGGRAPYGYQLEHVATGAVRDGIAVTKSHLVPSKAAPAIAAYLRDRAAGIQRFTARRTRGLELQVSSLIYLERNAMTYAGHTIWNRLNERERLGAKYRPRSEWEIKRDTHQALITDEEAAAILEQLERRARARSTPRKHDYLLAGILCTPAGQAWHGDEKAFYRHGRARRIVARRVDSAVLDVAIADLAGGHLADAILQSMRTRLLAAPDPKRAAAARRRIDELDRKIRRLGELAAGAEVPAPLLRTMGELERERQAIDLELAGLQREASTTRSLRRVDEHQVREALRGMAVDLGAGKDVQYVRDILLQLLHRVELDPEAPEEVVLHYRVPGVTGVEVASPRRSELNPGNLVRRAKLAA